MSGFSVVDHSNDNLRSFDSRAEADDKKHGLKSLVDNPNDIEVVQGSYEDYADYEANHDPETEDVDAEVIDMTEQETPADPGTPAAQQADPRDDTPVEPGQKTNTVDPEQTVAEPQTDDALDQLGESLGTDPLSILPGHMIDQIQGQPAINKRGYAMIAERYGVSVKAHIESYPWENDNGRCVARAVATTEEGNEYQDYATASKDDGDMPEQLIELASTRALKRVTGWATGLGIVSYQELSQELEG